MWINSREQEKQTELFEYKEPSTRPNLSLLDEKQNEYSDETSEESLRRLGDLVDAKLAEYGITYYGMSVNWSSDEKQKAQIAAHRDQIKFNSEERRIQLENLTQSNQVVKDIDAKWIT